MTIKKAGILGFGLIGGSIALAIKKRCNLEIVAFSRSEAPLLKAFGEGVLSEYSVSDLGIFRDCDIVFLCTPVDRICGYAEKLAPILKKDCILTDAGSTKGEIFDVLSENRDLNYIGGHPMAGSEKTGYNAAKDSLYENAFYVLTPSAHTESRLVEEYKELVEKIGAIPIILDPYRHDYIVAAISHIPHIVAVSLVNTVHSLDNDGYMHTLAAGGFRDITRIASSGAEMWSGICCENKDEILKVLDSFSQTIGDFKQKIESGDQSGIAQLFSDAKAYRDSFESGKGRGPHKSYSFKADISDRPGAIAEIAKLLGDNGINIKNMNIMNNRDYSDGVMTISLESDSDVKKACGLLESHGFCITL